MKEKEIVENEEALSKRWYEVFCVIDPPFDNVSEIVGRLNSDPSHFGKYAFILHDHDFKDNGEPEIPHFHFYAYSKLRPRKKGWIKLIADAFGSVDNAVSVRKCGVPEACLQYMTHQNKEESAHSTPYDRSLIISNLPRETIDHMLDISLDQAFNPSFDYFMDLYRSSNYNELQFLRHLGVDKYIKYRPAIDKVLVIMHKEKIMWANGQPIDK